MASPAPEIRGVIATCLTPFADDGEIDLHALEREIDYIVDVCRADAIGIGATEDAEYTMLTREQRHALISEGVKMVGSRVPVIVGVSHPAIERTTELAERAAEAGANVVEAVMPIRLWGGDPDPDETYDYVAEVARRSPLPLCVSHNRGPGADPAIPLYLRIADVFNVPYIVETSGDITRISRLAEEIDRRGSARYFTTIPSLLINLTLGGSGAVMPPPAAYAGAHVVRAFREGDMERAIEWQRILGLFPGRWYRYGNPPVMKAAMRHLGIDVGDPAPPFGRVSRSDQANIGQFLEEVGLKERGEDAPAPQNLLGPIGLRSDLLKAR